MVGQELAEPNACGHFVRPDDTVKYQPGSSG